MKIHGVLYLIVLFAIDTSDCKCEEYIIVLQETTYPGINFQPMKTEALHELSSLYNSTRLYHELDSYNECILEMDCKGYSTYCPKKVVGTNHGKHSEENRTMDKACKTENDTNVCNNTKSDYMDIEDQPVYDLNIIYVNKNDIQNNTQLHNKTKYSMFMVVCVYAENSCNGDDVNKTNLNHFVNISNDIALNETMKELVLTLKRDEGSMIQPIFTGFASENATTGSTKNTPLEVTLTCKFIENTHCKRKVNNTSEEMLAVSSNSINVYFKSEYIKKGTKIKYTGCKKDSGDKNNTFHIQCDATNFTSNNQDVLYTLTKSPEHNKILNLHCDITKSNLTTAARRSKDFSQNDNNLLHFNDCYTNQNISNQTKFGGQNMTIVLGSRRVIDNITINDDVILNKTKVPFTTTEDKININDEKIFKLHITTNKSTNCSQNQLFSITEGYVTDKEKYLISEDLPKYNDVELKLLNCLNDTYSVNNNTKTNDQKSKLMIIFKHETDVNKIEEQLGEPSEPSNIILVCNTSNHDEYEHEIDSNEKKVFECEYADVNNYTITDMNSSNILTNVTKEEMIHSHKGNRSGIDEENKDNCSSNTTEKTDCAPKCDTENVDGCNNISINDVNNKKNESMDGNDIIKKNNFTINSKNANDSQSNGRVNPTIENGYPLDKIGLIVLISIAGIGVLLAVALKKCAKRSEYRPAPVRDLHDLEDTAF